MADPNKFGASHVFATLKRLADHFVLIKLWEDPGKTILRREQFK
jgi:hypothetical protein